MVKTIKEIIEAEYGTNLETYKDEVSTLYSVNNISKIVSLTTETKF
jgi:hypothetical protein